LGVFHFHVANQFLNSQISMVSLGFDIRFFFFGLDTVVMGFSFYLISPTHYLLHGFL
jgi:hypothetical protein